MNKNIIAIDGPAGSGKSSVAREIAGKTDFFYMDSGAYYRAITYYILNIYKKEKSIDKFNHWLSQKEIHFFLKSIVIDSNLSKTEENKTYLNSVDVSIEIRDPEVTEEIKYIAVIRDVRDFVNKNLYNLSENYKIVMDGRDIGTEVFPDAYLKFYLTADPEVRAKRRFDEYTEKGVKVDFNQLKEEIIKRDESDINRKIAPLKKASDAILIDTSNLSKNIVINMILSRI